MMLKVTQRRGFLKQVKLLLDMRTTPGTKKLCSSKLPPITICGKPPSWTSRCRLCLLKDCTQPGWLKNLPPPMKSNLHSLSRKQSQASSCKLSSPSHFGIHRSTSINSISTKTGITSTIYSVDFQMISLVKHRFVPIYIHIFKEYCSHYQLRRAVHGIYTLAWNITWGGTLTIT